MCGTGWDEAYSRLRVGEWKGACICVHAEARGCKLGVCPVLLLSALFLISLRQGLSLNLEVGCYSASPSGSPVSICHRIKATDAHSRTQILMCALEIQVQVMNV